MIQIDPPSSESYALPRARTLSVQIVGLILAFVALIWKRERSLLLVPVILLGLVALLFAVAAVGGGNPWPGRTGKGRLHAK